MRYETLEEIAAELEANPVERSGHVYIPIPFSEFARLKSSTDPARARRKLEIVERVIDRRKKLGLPWERVLDIGANAGLFTFALAESGAVVTAYEPHPRYGPIGSEIARLRSPRVDWFPRAFTEDDLTDETWDVALMLSTFQWITDGDKRLDEGLRLLRRLSERTACLVFELGLNSGKSTITTQKRNHVCVIDALLRKHTVYENVRLIKASRIWPSRALWRGWRFMFACSNDDPRIPEVSFAALRHLRF